jgi:serine/threonine protein kinase
MFSGWPGGSERYDILQHLHEITLLFGPFPLNLLDRACQWKVKGIFDSEGNVWGAPIPDGSDPTRLWDLLSEAFEPIVERDGLQEFRNFISFLCNMMKIDPEQRMSAAQLLDEPWLTNVEL